VAGSDSGAGAGLQADLKAFAAHRVFGTCVVSAVTAQNTVGVLGVVPMTPQFVELQLEAVLGDFPVVATKTGMLASSDIVCTVARWAAAGRLPNLVVDPVLASSTGMALLDDGALDAYRDALLPHALVVTPNLREAALLTGATVGDVDSMIAAARRLADMGPPVVVVKGGHLGHDASPDVVLCRGELTVLDAPRWPTTADHGTGCTLSATIAALLAHGREPVAAVAEAKRYVAGALRQAADWHLGAGRGPLDHFGWGDHERHCGRH